MLEDEELGSGEVVEGVGGDGEGGDCVKSADPDGVEPAGGGEGESVSEEA